MKKAMRVLTAAACTVTLAACMMMSASATTFVRKFNGAQGVKNSTAAVGVSTFEDGVVTATLPASGSLCWSYVSDVQNLTFQFRIDADTDPEFDWFGLNIIGNTSDPTDMLLGHGNGLSTIFWRTSTDITSRFVEDVSGSKWDDVANTKEIMSGPLYDGTTNVAPYKDFRWGDGEWATFSMTRGSDGAWSITVNGLNMIQTPYTGFNSDMDRLFSGGEAVISLFLSNPTGTLQVRGVDTSTSDTDSPAGTTQADNTTADSDSGTTVATAVTDANGSAVTAATDANGSEVVAATDANGSAVTTTSGSGVSTTKAATTTTTAAKAASSDSDTTTGSTSPSYTWIVVLVIVILLAGAGVAVYFLVIKKKPTDSNI